MWFKQKAKSAPQNSITRSHNMPAKLMINPLIVVNMGAEMIYILQQRLRAQSISDDKSSRVLADTVTALFDMQMISRMFEPGNMWQSAEFRELFHNVTHSSIMRLNDQSMDKLYDLMIMGLKVQVLTSRDPLELIESTLNHVDNITHIVENKVIESEQVCELITSMRVRIIQTYTVLNYGKLVTIRNLLLQFLQDRRIKVSILLQKGLQASNGYIKISTDGILPKYCDIPGKSQKLNGTEVVNEQSLDLPSSSKCEVNNITYNWHHGFLATNIGDNLYASNDDTKPDQANAPADASNATASAPGASNASASGAAMGAGSNSITSANGHFQSPQRISSTSMNPKDREQQKNAATNELNFLASMISTDANGGESTNDNLAQGAPGAHRKHSMLDLFEIENDDIDLNFAIEDDAKSKKNKSKDLNTVRFGKESNTNRLTQALNDLDLGDGNDKVKNGSQSSRDFDSTNKVKDTQEDDEDDLLALMDDMPTE